ncbi:MAG: type II secretion system F family protein, partial [Abditibacteriaceae bacterium]
QSGVGITAALASTRQFPAIVLQMLQTGEVSGDFEKQLDSAATFLEEESETSIKKSMKVLGVLVLFLAGILVLMQMVHFYTGYYNNMFDQVDKMSQ